MPISLWIDRSARLRYSKAFGVLTDRDLIEVYGGMARDSLNDATLDHIADFRDVERVEVTKAGLEETARIMARRIDPGLAWADMRSKIVMIASSDEVIELLRTYQRVREAAGSRVSFYICRTMEEARAWLGMSEESETEGAARDDQLHAERNVS